MKGFNKRERRIISYVYADAARICWERESEAHEGWNRTGQNMAKLLKNIMSVRAEQILKRGCDLPRKRKFGDVR